MEHPDVISFAQMGCPSFLSPENQDSPENRKEFIEENTSLLLDWLWLGYPDILNEFIEMNAPEYRAWLN